MLDIFDLLGSQTRRKILELLSDEPSYLSEISKVLGIGHKALISHLTNLEDFGLLKSYEKESSRAPSRKYYKISKDTCLWVRISSKGYQTEIFDPKKKIPKGLKNISNLKDRFNEVDKNLKEIDSYTDLNKKFSEIYSTLNDLVNLKNQLLSSLYNVENNMSVLQHEMEDTLNELFNPDEAEVISAIIGEKNTLEEIVEHTRMNPYHVMYILKDFEEKGLAKKKGNGWALSEKYLKEQKKALGDE